MRTLFFENKIKRKELTIMNSDTRLALSEVKGPLTDLLERLNGENGGECLAGLKKFLRGEDSRLPILEHISGDKRLVISAHDGQQTIAQAGELFTGGVSSNFKKWGTNVAGEDTPEIEVVVYETQREASFFQMFTFISDSFRGLDYLCLQQGQILNFVRNYQSWIGSEGSRTFFLFKVGSDYFVADISFNSSNRLEANISCSDDCVTWVATNHLRVVVPKKWRNPQQWWL